MSAEHTPGRFRIFWSGASYKVSIPNYHGGEVVKSDVADALVSAIEAMLKESIGRTTSASVMAVAALKLAKGES